MSTPYALGENAVLYYQATPVTSTTATVATTAAVNVKSVKINAKNDTPEYTTRANNGVKSFANSLSELGCSFEIKCPGAGNSDAAYTAFQSAWVGKTEIAAWALTYASTVTGAEGPAGNFIVSSFEIPQENGAVEFATVELKPSSFNGWHISV